MVVQHHMCQPLLKAGVRISRHMNYGLSVFLDSLTIIFLAKGTIAFAHELLRSANIIARLALYRECRPTYHEGGGECEKKRSLSHLFFRCYCNMTVLFLVGVGFGRTGVGFGRAGVGFGKLVVTRGRGVLPGPGAGVGCVSTTSTFALVCSRISVFVFRVSSEAS